MRVARALIVAGVLILVPGIIAAQESDKKKDKASSSISATISASVFSSAEKKAITDYYAKHPAGAKPLPPGIAKNLSRGKPLPPGIAKTRLPADALKSVPPRKDGSEITIFGDKVVLLQASGLVVDILEGVLR